MIITAKQRNDALHADFQMDMTIYKDHPELYGDETSTDRKFGHGLWGSLLKDTV